ncbi:M28 family peptidase [Nocardioides jishulii]|uniref:M28 family peptidase n=1 Tax=Nocardioides jishulii TaxID=2575440 RepID=UPI001BAF846B|nr:M28 family peptidase [Nocardioides jishulii]
MKRRVLQAVVGGAVSALVVSTAPVAPVSAHGSGHGGNPGKTQVTGKAVYRHLEAFQRIADANGGNRAMGTPGYEASARYIEKNLRQAGYTPQRQYFDVEAYTVDTLEVTVPGVELAPVAMEYSSSTPGAVTQELVTPTDALGCDAAAWDGVDVAGKIAVVSRGSCPFTQKAVTAGEVDAAAIIIYNNTMGVLSGTLGEITPGSAPAVGVTQAEGEALVAAIGAGTVTGTFNLQGSVQTQETFNVIAETRGGDPDNVVMVGGHLDGVEDGAGINDNGSGSAAILETALQLAKSSKGAKKGHPNPGKLNNKVRFAWWGAEELGLHGSNHYVADLQANDPDELENLAVYLNFDMVASPNFIIGVYDADESTYEAPVVVPPGSAAAEKAFTDYFDSIGQPWVDTEFSGRSDYSAFIDAGVPSTGLFTGADDVKTPEQVALFGGTAGILLDPNYHSALDDINNVSKEALDINSRAIGSVVASLAYSTEAINGVKPPTKHKHDKKKHPKKDKHKKKGPKDKGKDKGKKGPKNKSKR